MSLFAAITLLILSTALSWAGLVTVITSISPTTSDWFGFLLFYASLTLSLTGSFSLVGFLVRSIFVRSQDIKSRLSNAFRQGLFFALLMDGFLVMQHWKLLTWYNAAFLIIALSLLEFFSISRRTVRV